MLADFGQAHPDARTDVADRIARYVSLVGVVAAAVALAVLWVYMVPMLEASDETEHFDYVLALTHAGKILPGRPVLDAITTATADDEARFFETYSDFYRINLNRHDRVPAGYGTHQYFERIDRKASATFPDRWTYWDDPTRPKPGLIGLYPFGFYAANALWLHLFALFDRSQVALFYAARWFSVGLLAITLVFMYGVARELRLSEWVSLTLTAVIGMHSLTSFVASYVQPDNMALTLISVILFLSLRMVRRRVRRSSLAVLALALGALSITKYQFFACTAVVVFAMVAVDIVRQRRTKAEVLQFAAIFAMPPVVALLLQRTMVGSDPAYVSAHLSSTLPTFSNLGAFFAWLHVFGGLLLQAVYHFFIGGFHSELEADPHYSGSVSYWGNAGWLDTPLSFGNAAMDSFVHFIIQGCNVAIVILTVVWMFRTLLRLGRLARKKKQWTALRLVVANTPINLYFIFIAFMVFFFALTNNALRLSGRNWFPVMEPAFLLGFLYAPRAIPNRRFRSVFGATILALLALYATVGSYYAALSVHDRYYGAPYLPPLSALAPGHKTEISIQRVFSAPIDNAIDAPIDTEQQVIQGDVYHIAGWAADVDRRRAAGGVIALVDGRDEFPATYGYSNVPISEQLHNFLYYWAGYQFFIPTNNLSVGPHTVSFFVVSSDLKESFATRQSVHFTVVPPTLPQPYQFDRERHFVGSIDRLGSAMQRAGRSEARPVWLSTFDTLSANGWIIDVRNRDLVKHVYATLDGGTRYDARLGEPRRDLIEHFPAVPQSISGYAGYSISIPLQHLPPGAHRVAFSVLDARTNRPVSLAENFPFTTYAPGALKQTVQTEGVAWPVPFGDRDRILGYIDRVTTLDLATDYSWLAAPVWLANDNYMFVRGWALDLAHGVALRDLWFTFDGTRRFSVRPGGLRVDIPDSFPTFPQSSTYYCGFTAAIPMQQFEPGRHRMTLWGVDPISKRDIPLVKNFPITVY